MVIADLLTKKKDSILKRWFNLIIQTYPDNGAGFLKNKDRFTNPVGYITSSTIAILYEELLQGLPDADKVATSLSDIIKLRAIQNFSPSQAISFVFLLKKAIRSELGNELQQAGNFEELSNFDSRIDELASYAFDIFMDCREIMYKAQVNEMKLMVDNVSNILERQSRKGAVV